MNQETHSLWQEQMDAAFAAFLSSVRTMVHTEQLTVRPVVISTIADAPPHSDTDRDMPLVWQSPLHIQLDILLKKAGFPSITHLPLTTDQSSKAQSEHMKAQLSALSDPHVLIVCTPTYADLAEAEGAALSHMLSAFGAGKKDCLLPLMADGDFSHAVRIVPKHFLFRDWQPALHPFNGRTGGMPDFMHLFCPLSGNHGVGLLPDLLDLSNERNARHAPQYATHLATLERIQARITTDDILSQDLVRQCTQHRLYPHLSSLPIPCLNPNHRTRQSSLPPDLSGLVHRILGEPAIKTALLSCASPVDTELTGLALIRQLRCHPRNPRIMTINLGQYPKKAAPQCVALHLNHVLQLDAPIIQDMKQQRLDHPKVARTTVWVLTNYHQIGTYLNIYVANALASWNNAKVLVTCNAQYFDRHDPQTCFLSDPTNPDLSSFVTYSINPFASHIPDSHNPQPLPNLDALLSTYSPRRMAQQRALDQFLNHIQPLAKHVGKAFISYAWEKGAALMRQQRHVRQLAHDLSKAGIPTWLDVEHMTGDMNTQMQQNIENSQYAILIGTPRYTQRTTASTNVKREYDAIIQRYDAERINILPLRYLPDGTFDQITQSHPSFPADFPKSLPIWDVQDIDDFDHYIRHMTDSTQGILPHMLGCAAQDTTQRAYQKALNGLHQSLALLPAQHLILKQAEQDQMIYEVPTRQALYIEARGKSMPKDAQAFSLTPAFDAFLDDRSSGCNTFVTLGEGGSGKSLFAQIQYARLFEKWHHAKDNTHPDWIPVYIPLKHYAGEHEVNTCVETALRAVYHCHDVDIDHLKNGSGVNLGVLLIFDGLDELGGQTPNLYQANGLHTWQCPLKLLITTRVDTVPDPETHQHIFGSQGEHTFKRAYIQPFSQEDIQTYIRLYQAKSLIQDSLTQAKRDEDAGVLAPVENPKMDTYERLASLPGLLELLCNPFLLNLVLQGLPYLLAKRQGSGPSHQAVSRLDIYDAFTQYWFGKEVYRRVHQDDPDLRCYFESQAEGLAFALYLKKALSVSETHNPLLWKQFFHDPNHPKVAQAMAALPLKWTGDGRYEFMHKTLWAYFTYRYIASAHQRPHPNPEALMHALAARPVGAQAEMAAGVPLPLQEKGVYSFFHDALHAPSLKTALFEQITRSIPHANQPLGPHALASAHAATLLAKSGIPMNQQAWAGVQLPGADLCDAQLYHTDLQGAQLRGAYLGHAFLWGADLRRAHLQGVRFGEMPPVAMNEQVYALAQHPKKPWIASTDEHKVVIKHRENQETICTLEGHTEWIFSLAFSPNGDLLVSGSDDHTLRLWQIHASGAKPLGDPLTGHNQGVTSVAFSPNRELVVSGSWDETLRLWQIHASGAQPFGDPCTGHTDFVTCVAFSPKGDSFVSGSDDQTLRLWQIHASGATPLGDPCTGHTSTVKSVAWSPNGQYLISGGDDQTLRLWRIEAGRAQPIGLPLRGHTKQVNCVAFSPCSTYIVSGSNDQTLRLWHRDVGGARLMGAPLTGHTHHVTSVTFSPCGSWIISGSWDKTLRLWHMESEGPRSIPVPLRGHTKWVNSVAFSPKGNRVVSGGGDQTLHLWQMEAGIAKPIGIPLKAHLNSVTHVAFSPSGDWLASGSVDTSLRLWKTEYRGKRALSVPLMGHTHWVNCLAFSPNGMQIVSGSHDCTLRLWQIKNQSAHPIGLPLTGHTEPVSSVAFSPDGALIISGSWDNTLRLWQIKDHSAKPLEEPLIGHTDRVNCAAFSPDGAQIVSGSHDHTLRLWQIKTYGAKPIGGPLNGHTEPVTCVTFHHNGNLVVSGSDDRTLRVWHVPTKNCVQVVHWITAIKSMALSVQQPDVAWASLVVGDVSGGVGSWSLQASSEYLRFLGMSPQPNWGIFWRRMWSRVALTGMRLSSATARMIAAYREEPLASLPITLVDDDVPLASADLEQPLSEQGFQNKVTPEVSNSSCCNCM